MDKKQQQQKLTQSLHALKNEKQSNRMTDKTETKTERKGENQAVIMEHAMTDQKNLNADTDRARSFKHECKGSGKE